MLENHYEWGFIMSEEFKKILSNTKSLLDSNQLNDKEKKVTKQIIKAFESVTKY